MATISVYKTKAAATSGKPSFTFDSGDVDLKPINPPPFNTPMANGKYCFLLYFTTGAKPFVISDKKFDIKEDKKNKLVIALNKALSTGNPQDAFLF